uniref:hypothetical protein n=1 Tax=Marinobacterium profundum TaxID=1714300 RepID=UPI0008367765|nr:hypothetical protein [Marinobacterium profundum]
MLTDEEILTIACDDTDGRCIGVEGGAPGEVFNGYEEDVDVSDLLIIFARKIIAKAHEQCLAISDEQLRQMATEACVEANGGFRDWNTMFSGDQEAHIDAWSDGYRAALKSDSNEEAPNG